MKIKIRLVLLIAILTFGCQDRKDKNIVPGSICLITDGAGTFGVIKVITIDEHIVRMKIYTNRYQKPPSTIDLKTLNSQDSVEENKIAMIERKDFDTWKPVPLKVGTIK